MQLIIREFDMKLNYPFSISRHTYYSQPNVIVELRHAGFTGYGEATLNPYYGITLEKLRDHFISMNRRLMNYQFQTPDILFDEFSDFLEIDSFALAALNNASWDLYGKMNNCPTGEFINLQKSLSPVTSYTLGIDQPEVMLKKAADLPWPIYKVKLGTHDDLGLLTFLRKHINSVLRVDANCAWTAEQTIQLSKKLKALNIEFIEQPLPYGDPEQSRCFLNSVLPLIADESCRIESDVDRCTDNFHGINIKLLKCGGISPAIRMIKKARKSGLSVMMGCMTETSVGISAAAQLLPYVDFADLDGPLLLAEDTASGLTYEKGRLHVSEKSGLGITYTGKRNKFEAEK
jgi:L-Ala-D/L-Glu epimerase